MISKIINQAILDGADIEICYTKYDGTTSIRVLSEVHYSDVYGNTHIEGYCHTRKESRTFKIDRISKVRIVQKKDETDKSEESSESSDYQFNPNKRIFNLYG